MCNLLRPAIGSVSVLGFVAGGCSGNGPVLPSLPELAETFSETPVVGSPTEVYEHIARGALTCWFGSAGPLKAGYVYHAEADPPGKGGRAEITIHERVRLADNPKGERAYRIAIVPENARTTLRFENLKMPEAKATLMETDARRWGTGAFGCAGAESGGWSENEPPPPAPQAEGKRKHSP